MEEREKIIAKDQWAEKFIRETPFMPFGSMCNLIGQALKGKGEGITIEQFETLTKKAFELSLDFTRQAFESVKAEKAQDDEPEVKIKK